AMLAVLGNIEDSVAYKEIKEESRDEGRNKGVEIGTVKGAIKNLDELLADGILSSKEYEKRITPLKKQLAELQTKYGH
ncbi:MAG: hypothetical protein GY807_11680, partial [Gammaproteobacteria bacterium]|nr:hypothetical protein [Gammaproteobacteria bacterium]